MFFKANIMDIYISERDIDKSLLQSTLDIVSTRYSKPLATVNILPETEVVFLDVVSLDIL